MRWPWRKQRVAFVDRAPTRSGADAPLRVTRMSPNHVLWWDSHVQPVIDEDPTRVDNGWDWTLYLPMVRLGGTVTHHEPAAYTVGLVADEKDALVPVALVLMLGRYPGLDNHRKSAGFLWFLTTIPDEALLSLDGLHLTEDRLPKRLGTIALDVAVTHSLNRRRRGRLGLHADDAGGEPLLAWYERRGMDVLPADIDIPFGLREFIQPSDGRYCYYTTKTATTASTELDAYRGTG